MAITINTPLTAPNNLQAVVTNSGGSLAIGTYSFFVFDRGNSGNYTTNPMWTSPAVYLTGIVVSVANSKIDLSWNSTDVRKTYSMIFWKKDSDGYNAHSQTGIAGSSITFTNYSTQIVSYLPSIENATKTPHNFSSTRGIGNIKISGAAGNITIANIAAALVGQNDYYYDGYSSLWMLWSIDSTTATSGTLDLTGYTLWSYGGIFNGTGMSLSSTFPLTGQGLASIGVGAYCGSADYFYPGKASLAFCQLITNVQGLTGFNVYGGARPKWTNAGSLTNGFMNGQWTEGGYYNSAINCWIGGEFIYYGDDAVNEIKGLQLWGGFRTDYGYKNWIIRDLISIAAAGYNFRYGVDNYQNTTNPTPVQKFINCVFKDSSGNQLANNIPLVYWIMNNPDSMNPLPLTYSFNLKIINKFGVGINNANVKILYNGTVVNTGNSNSNGIVAEQLITYATITHKVGSGKGMGANYTTTVLYNSFTIIISANGYETYKKTFSISSAINWIIKLRHSISSGDDNKGDEFG